MADIFISYAHEERDFAQQLADVLNKAGLEVWWDRELYAGEDFGEMIQREIRQAAAVIVMWSKNSVKSRWVQGEASLADELQKLVTIKVDDCDLPINFRNLHTPEIFKSKEEFEKLLDLLQNKINRGSDQNDKLKSIDLKKEAIEFTMTGDFWKDYWKITKTGWQHPFSFGKNTQLSMAFYKKHWKVMLIILVIVLMLLSIAEDPGY